MDKFSIKMRASEEDKHISGAEQILDRSQLGTACTSLINRALTHDKGTADFIQLKMEKKSTKDIITKVALPVTTLVTQTAEEGQALILSLLQQMGLDRASEILTMFPQTYNMRGAMLLHVDTLKRLEPHKQRGIRATYMDGVTDTHSTEKQGSKGVKNHFQEALILATKVANCPHILGEICISDDPHYVTGYVASNELGYRRITTVKEHGSPCGGRIFLFRGSDTEKEEAIKFLQEQWFLVENVPPSPCSSPCSTTPPSGHSPFHRYQQELAQWAQADLLREEKVLYAPSSPNFPPSWVNYQGHNLLMMASNNYLGLTHHPAMVQAGISAFESYGCGTGGSRLTTGTTPLHMQLEETLARWKGTESALVFNSGYVANFSILSALLRPEDIVFSDALNHASLIDGCRHSKATIIVYAHNDMTDLEEKLQEHWENLPQGGQGFIVSDGVFSMDGDIAPVPELQALSKKYGLLFFLDEAHSSGVLGATGRGLCEYFSLSHKPDLLMGTLSKALGSEGGFLCGNAIIIEYLRHKARGFMFSTALTPAAVACGKKAIDLLEEDTSLVTKIQENVYFFNECCEKYHINAQSSTPIFPIIVGEEDRALRISHYLLDKGFFISPIRYPTVAKGEARLRVVLMAVHSKEELDATAQALAKALVDVP